MRTLAVLATATIVFALCPAKPVQAQIGEATSAFSSALRKAQRIFSGEKRRRRRKSRSMVAADGSIIIPPAPSANPRRGAATRTARVRTITPVRPPKAQPTPPPVNKTAAIQPPAKEPPKPEPDIWTPSQIEQAARACRKALGKVKAELKPVPPIKKGPCGSAAPYKLASLTGKHRVTFRPAPVLNCKMVAALDTWLRRGLQPLAIKHLGSPIARVSVMSSYSCRNAYGRKKTKLSEHALANALDIGGFVTAKGQKTMLLAHWGPTKRDLIAKAKREKEKREAEERRLAKQKQAGQNLQLRPSQRPESTVSAQPEIKRRQPATGRAATAIAAAPTAQVPAFEAADPIPPVPQRRPSLKERLQWAKASQTRTADQRTRESRAKYRERLTKFLLTPRSNLGGPKPGPKAGKTSSSGKGRQTVDRAAFLRGAHRTACRIFGTVLGPEANEAHRNHFHVDLAYRRRNNYCR